VIIDFDRIPTEGARLIGQEGAGLMELDGEADIEVLDGLRYDLTVQLDGEAVFAQGQLELDLRLRCSRCAEFFTTTVRERAYTWTGQAEKGRRSVDLTAELRESILLVFPTHPVCADTCRGLCPRCGCNLNAATCDCRPEVAERWGALDDLTDVGQ
jgi:uncharacterized protein